LGPGPTLLGPGSRGSAQTSAKAAGRGDWAGRPERGGERVTRNFNHANSDPGALGGASGLKCTENTRKNNAKKKRNKKIRIIKKMDGGEEVIIEPLNTWAQLFLSLDDSRRYGDGLIGSQVVQRCDVIKLLPTPEQEELLRFVGDQTARLINMENYRRRQFFFANRGIDTGVKFARELAKSSPEYQEVKRALGSANFDETLQKVSEAWKSFAELLKEKREGKLPGWINPRPPGYRKRDGERVPIIIVRADNYRVDVVRKIIRLRYWNIDVPFTGKLRWLTKPGAKHGRMEIIYDAVKRRWYAHISVKVAIERKSIGCNYMGIDIGREILLSATANNGTALLYRGSALKSDYYYFEKRISIVDSLLLRLEEVDRAVLKEERRRLYEKRKRRRDQIFANTAAHLARVCLSLGVGTVIVGYPLNIAKNKPGKGNTNLWSYKKLIDRLATTLENHGIAVFLINENNTSKKCAYHGIDVKREPRGLVTCPYGHVMHADVNASLNIMKRGFEALGIKAELPRQIKVLSFLPTPSRVVEKKKNP
jgi:putative transposase